MDAYQYFGNDIQVSNTGDVLLATGITLSQQRILRRLLTTPGTYLWDLNYGAGVGAFVGVPLSTDVFNKIVGLITTQMLLETSVAKTPAPVITLTANQTLLFCEVQYTDASNQSLEVLSFSVGQ